MIGGVVRRGSSSLAVEPGTIMGPNEYGEYIVCTSNVDGRSIYALATIPDIQAAVARDARSVTEVRHRVRLWQIAHTTA